MLGLPLTILEIPTAALPLEQKITHKKVHKSWNRLRYVYCANVKYAGKYQVNGPNDSCETFPNSYGLFQIVGENPHQSCWTLQFKQNNVIRKSQVNDQCVGHVGTMMISSFGAKIPQFFVENLHDHEFWKKTYVLPL